MEELLLKNVWIIVITLLLLLNAVALLFLSGYIKFQVPQKDAVTEPVVQLTSQTELEADHENSEIEPSSEPETTAQVVTEPNIQATPMPSPEAVSAEEMDNTNKDTSSKSSSNHSSQSSMYNMTSEQIQDGISFGKGPNYMSSFSIPAQVNTFYFDYYDNPIIKTPYLNVAQLANVEYYENDRTITEEEARSVIDYEKLSFLVYFKGEFSKLFAVELSQNNIIEPVSTENASNSTYKLVTYSTSNIDFTQPAVLRVFLKDDPEQYSDHMVDFSAYIK